MTAKAKKNWLHILSLLAGVGIGIFVRNPRSQAIAQATEAVAEEVVDLAIPVEPAAKK
jgi:hypothetical protein